MRVNPDFELKTSGMKMGGGPKQFGIDAERVPEVLARHRARCRSTFVGFHIFSGSQNLRAEAIIEAQQKTVALAVRLAQHAPAPVRIAQHRRRLRHSVFPGRAAARPRADRREPATLLPRDVARALPRSARS